MPPIGSSVHDKMLFDTSVKATRPKPPRRKIYLWKRADVQGIKDHQGLAISIQRHQGIDQAWESLKPAIMKTIEKRVPSKMATARHVDEH